MTRTARRLRWPALLVLALAFPSGAFADATITSSGPLTAIGATSDLNCSVNHTGDTKGEWYLDTACGTFVATGGTLYGPASIPAGSSASPRTTYTPVSQSAVTGTGTNNDPYKIVTVVDLGSTGLRLTQTDSYVVGEESYRTDVQLQNTGNSTQSAIIYRAGDCYLAESDSGFGAHDLNTGSVTCISSVTDPDTGTTSPGPRIEQLLPLSAGSKSFESDYDTVWAKVGAQAEFDNTCACDQDIDNGLGLSWAVTLTAGASTTKSSLMSFSPTGHVPLITTKTADASSAFPSASDGYTITISNPNSSSVSLSSITDTLPSGFTYTADSTSGATTANPQISGQTLTWSGPISVPASSNGTAGKITLHFGVTVAGTAGDYYNNATAASADYSVAPTGDTALITVTAPPHTLTVDKSGAGSGTVTSSPSGINCGNTCSAQFAQGSTVTLTAVAASGSVFTGWSGGGCSGTGQCQVTMSADTTVTATFAAGHDLTVIKNGTGSGSVSSSPTGISCGNTCTAGFLQDTVVTLTASAAAGSTFTGWSGEGCSGTGQCQVTMSAARSVTATFTRITHTLDVSRTGSGSGSVSSSPAGIDCGATCSAPFDEGSTVTLTATPATGSTFTGWSGGGCSGTGTCQVTMSGDQSVVATFTLNSYALTVNRTGSGTGSVTGASGAIDCGATCGATFPYGTSVTLTATPTGGSTFTGWSGACSGTGTCTVTMDQARSVTATFTAPPPPDQTLTVSKAGSGSGSVTSSPAGIDCGPTCAASFTNGTTVTLTAVAADGSTFTGWSGACSGTGTCTVTMDAARSVTATFDALPVMEPPGSVSGGGLFCGVQHRGKCTGLKIKDEFDRPGNAVWEFAAYNPTPGNSSSARAASAKVIVLGTLKRKITKAGKVTVVFKLKPGAKTRALYKRVLKAKLKAIRVKLTFTPLSGPPQVQTMSVKLKK